MKLFKISSFKLRPLPAALLAAVAALPLAQAQERGAEAMPMQSVVVLASRSNILADQAAQTVVIIKREEIERQLAISNNSSDVLSSVLPSYTPSRGKMNGSGETLRGRTP